MFLDALVDEGKAVWLDTKKDRCLILWKSVEEWADSLYSWCKGSGESVILVQDLCSHDGEMQGSDISGLPMDLVIPIIACLEKSKKAKYVCAFIFYLWVCLFYSCLFVYTAESSRARLGMLVSR